jgi:L-histidine N-alpha-methyltransferase
MADDVREGLRQPLPSLPCKYFYDDRGSELFDAITRLPEYYQTRTEERILEGIAERLIQETRPRELVELGSGTSRKLTRLLEAGRAHGSLERLLLFDVNEAFLRESAERLARAYPGLAVAGVVGDFTTEDLSAIGSGAGRLLAFFAGTIGNLHPREVPAFLTNVGGLLAPGNAFLVGVDLVKDEALLHAAYNDAAGVTAEFNRNILRVVNAALEGDFRPEQFEHVAFYDRDNAWIEMRLRAQRAMDVRLRRADVRFHLDAGSEIRTEISCKYTRRSFAALLPGTGFALADWHTDERGLFALALLRREAVSDG